ncbi:dihydrofolate reductase [Mariniluteicoccus endophyticus]
MTTSRHDDVAAIVAVARNGVIGKDNDMLWHLPGDWPRVKALTTGGVLVMGRRTFESIGRPLPGRDSYVVTRNPDWSHEGARTFTDVDAAIDAALASGKPVWIFGGGQIYAEALPRTTRIELTEVPLEPEGDAFFPDLDPADWREVARESLPTHDNVTLVRR